MSTDTSPSASAAVGRALARAPWGTIATIALVGVALSWLTGFLPVSSAILVTLTTALAAGLAWRSTPPRRVALGVGAALVVYGTFIGVGARARQLVVADAADRAPERLIDAAIAPLPANPRCWSLSSLSVTDDVVVLRRGVVLPFGGEPEQLCRARTGEPTAPLVPVAQPSSGPVRIQRTMRYPRAALAAVAGNCHAAVFFRWSRLPFHLVQGEQIVIGDLRYDFDASIGWAELALPPDGTPCPRFVPDWTPPREGLLSESP